MPSQDHKPASANLGVQFAILIRFIFCMAVITIAVMMFRPVKPKANSLKLKALFAGSAEVILPLGHEAARIRPLLPKTGKISLITDTPYKKYSNTAEFHHAIQNYVCPLIVTKEITAPVSIVYTSSNEIAAKRLESSGYRFIQKTSPGKGVALKKS